jgi:hypothetical protein
MNFTPPLYEGGKQKSETTLKVPHHVTATTMAAKIIAII